MKIGFDLDKIFIDYPPFVPDSLIDRLYRKKADGELVYRIPSRPEQFLRQVSHYHRFRAPIRENIELLHSLTKKKHHLYLISSRFDFLEKQTIALLHNLKLDQLFESMYFNFHNEQPHIFKNNVLKKLQLDIYVDDDIYLLQYVAPFNKKTKLFWLNPKKTHFKPAGNIKKIHQLTEIIV